MPNLEVGTLEDHLSDDEIRELLAALERAGIEGFAEGDKSGSGSVGETVDEDAVTEFMDRLEGHDVAADLYLPVEFDGRIDAADRRIGSLMGLLDVLEEIADDLEIEDSDDPVESEDDDDVMYATEMEILDARLRVIWHAMFEGAHTALEHGLSLVVIH
ncbi:MAG: hypothetical protein J7M25_10620 [Deltaproteobacteria bacterium]|nr:hypothetical protein [Deltaproteobacteria bacterium]